MSDLKLRELERRWQETRAAADEAALARERLRAGDLTPEWLELGVHVGYPAALIVGEVEPRRVQPLADWVGEVERWGKEALVRVALAAARCVLPVFAREQPGDLRPHALVAAAEEWLQRPGPETAKRAATLLEEVRVTRIRRARYAYATADVLDVIGAPLAPPLAWGLSLPDAERVQRQLHRAGVDCAIAPGQARPDAPQTVFLRQAVRNRPRALEALQRATGASLEDARAGLFATPAREEAKRTVSSAADRSWAADGLSEDEIRAAIRREVGEWALHGATRHDPGSR